MKKNIIDKIIFLLGSILVAIYTYIIVGCYEIGIETFDFLEKITQKLQNPLVNFGGHWNKYSLIAIFSTELIFSIACILYNLTKKNYMFMKEHGSSDWGNVRNINKEISKSPQNQNKILTEHLQISMDTEYTQLNNNTLGMGGSGCGKTFYYVIPNILKGIGSYVITDPKGEILQKCGTFLEKMGYNIKVLNLIKMEESCCYNPFAYIKSEEDVIKLITNLIANTTPKNATKGDPFWEKSESMFLQCIVLYVWIEIPPKYRTFNTVLDLVNKAKILEDEESELDIIMKELEYNSPLGKNHPAALVYQKFKSGAGDTMRSIIISVHSRLAFFETEQLKRILNKNDIDIAAIGMGKNGDKTTKTALFCVIPDVDKSYNFVIGMLYTQIFQELYYQADFNSGGALPIPVSFWLDEFANVALPDEIVSLTSTMRSRNISINAIIQNLAQIKALFKDTWETIVGNCDTLLYLGGNEQSSHKYISEELGKRTINKRSSSQSFGKNPSFSRSYDVLGRELMTPAEVRKLNRKQAIVLIRGFNPILDEKYNTKKHILKNGKISFPIYKYKNSSDKNNENEIELINQNSMQYLKKMSENGENVVIATITMEELLSLPEDGDIEKFVHFEKLHNYNGEEKKEEKKLVSIFIQKLKEKRRKKAFEKKTVLELIQQEEFTEEQLREIQLGLSSLSEDDVKQYMKIELTANQMEQYRLRLEKEKELYKNME